MLLLTIIYFVVHIYFSKVNTLESSTWKAFYEGFNQEINKVQHKLKQAVESSDENSYEQLLDDETVGHIKSMLYMLRPTIFGVKLQLYAEEDKSYISMFLDTPKLLLQVFDKHPNAHQTLYVFLGEFCSMFLDSMEQLWNKADWKAASYSDGEIGPVCRFVEDLCNWTKPKDDNQEVLINFEFDVNQTKLVDKVKLDSLAETLTVLSKLHNHALNYMKYDVVLKFDDFLAETVIYALPVMFRLKQSVGESSYLYQLAKKVLKYLMNGWAIIKKHGNAINLPNKTYDALKLIHKQCRENKNFKADPEFASTVIGFCTDLEHIPLPVNVSNEKVSFNLTSAYINFEQSFKGLQSTLEDVNNNFSTYLSSRKVDEEADLIMAKIVGSIVQLMKDHEAIKAAHKAYKPSPPSFQEMPGYYCKLHQYLNDIFSKWSVKWGITEETKKTIQASKEFKIFYQNAKMNLSNTFWADIGPHSFIFIEINTMESFTNYLAKYN